MSSENTRECFNMLVIWWFLSQLQQKPREIVFFNIFFLYVYIFTLYILECQYASPSQHCLLYSSSFCSHSLMLTEWGCDSICVGCKTGMIVELDICVFSDASLEEDYTSPSSSKDDTTYHHSHTHACHFVCRKNGFPQRWNHY